MEARGEVAEPGFSGQLREARRISAQLATALHLTPGQQQAIEPLLAAERRAQALAFTATDADLAQQHCFKALGLVLSASQLQACVALYPPPTGKSLLSGPAPLAAH